MTTETLDFSPVPRSRRALQRRRAPAVIGSRRTLAAAPPTRSAVQQRPAQSMERYGLDNGAQHAHPPQHHQRQGRVLSARISARRGGSGNTTRTYSTSFTSSPSQPAGPPYPSKNRRAPKRAAPHHQQHQQHPQRGAESAPTASFSSERSEALTAVRGNTETTPILEGVEGENTKAWSKRGDNRPVNGDDSSEGFKVFKVAAKELGKSGRVTRAAESLDGGKSPTGEENPPKKILSYRPPKAGAADKAAPGALREQNRSHVPSSVERTEGVYGRKPIQSSSSGPHFRQQGEHSVGPQCPDRPTSPPVSSDSAGFGDANMMGDLMDDVSFIGISEAQGTTMPPPLPSSRELTLAHASVRQQSLGARSVSSSSSSSSAPTPCGPLTRLLRRKKKSKKKRREAKDKLYKSKTPIRSRRGIGNRNKDPPRTSVRPSRQSQPFTGASASMHRSYRTLPSTLSALDSLPQDQSRREDDVSDYSREVRDGNAMLVRWIDLALELAENQLSAGKRYYDRGDFRRAKQCFLNVVRVAPLDSKDPIRGQVLLAGLVEKAEGMLKRIDAQTQQGKIMLQHWIDLGLELARKQWDAGNYHFHRGDLESAKQCFLTVSRIQSPLDCEDIPSQGELSMLIGQSQQMLVRIDETKTAQEGGGKKNVSTRSFPQSLGLIDDTVLVSNQGELAKPLPPSRSDLPRGGSWVLPDDSEAARKVPQKTAGVSEVATEPQLSQERANVSMNHPSAQEPKSSAPVVMAATSVERNSLPEEDIQQAQATGESQPEDIFFAVHQAFFSAKEKVPGKKSAENSASQEPEKRPPSTSKVEDEHNVSAHDSQAILSSNLHPESGKEEKHEEEGLDGDATNYTANSDEQRAKEIVPTQENHEDKDFKGETTECIDDISECASEHQSVYTTEDIKQVAHAVRRHSLGSKRDVEEKGEFMIDTADVVYSSDDIGSEYASEHQSVYTTEDIEQVANAVRRHSLGNNRNVGEKDGFIVEAADTGHSSNKNGAEQVATAVRRHSLGSKQNIEEKGEFIIDTADMLCSSSDIGAECASEHQSVYTAEDIEQVAQAVRRHSLGSNRNAKDGFIVEAADTENSSSKIGADIKEGIEQMPPTVRRHSVGSKRDPASGEVVVGTANKGHKSDAHKAPPPVVVPTEERRQSIGSTRKVFGGEEGASYKIFLRAPSKATEVNDEQFSTASACSSFSDMALASGQVDSRKGIDDLDLVSVVIGIAADSVNEPPSNDMQAATANTPDPSLVKEKESTPVGCKLSKDSEDVGSTKKTPPGEDTKESSSESSHKDDAGNLSTEAEKLQPTIFVPEQSEMSVVSDMKESTATSWLEKQKALSRESSISSKASFMPWSNNHNPVLMAAESLEAISAQAISKEESDMANANAATKGILRDRRRSTASQNAVSVPAAAAAATTATATGKSTPIATSTSVDRGGAITLPFTDESSPLFNQGMFRFSVKQFEEARICFSSALKIRHQKTGQADIGVCLMQEKLADTLIELGDIEGAHFSYLLAYRGLQAITSRDATAHLSRILVSLGNLFFSAANYFRALKYYDKSVKCRLDAYGLNVKDGLMKCVKSHEALAGDALETDGLEMVLFHCREMLWLSKFDSCTDNFEEVNVQVIEAAILNCDESTSKRDPSFSYLEESKGLLKKKASSCTHGDIILVLDSTARIHRDRNELSNALDCYLELFEYMKTNLPNREKGIAAVACQIGSICRRMGRYIEAIRYYSESLHLNQNAKAQSKTVALILRSLASTYLALRDDIMAMKYYQDHQQAIGVVGEIELLFTIGIIRCTLYDFAGALNCYIRARKLESSKKEGAESNDLVSPLINILQQIFASPKKVVQGAPPFERAQDSNDMKTILLSLGLVQLRRQPTELAHTYLKDISAYLNGDGKMEKVEFTSVLHGMGNILLRRNRYKEAITYYEKCLESYPAGDRVDEQKRVDYIDLETNIGTAYLKVGEHGKSLSHFKNALKGVKIARESVIRAQTSSGKLDGLQMLEEARTKRGDNREEGVLHFRHMIGIYLCKATRFDEAVSTLKDVEEKMIQLVGDNHPDILQLRVDMSNAYHLNGNISEARRLYHQVALLIRAGKVPDFHPFHTQFQRLRPIHDPPASAPPLQPRDLKNLTPRVA